MVVDAGRSAATRLNWESSVRQMVEQRAGELVLFSLEAQRPLTDQPSKDGYQLNETTAQVEAGVNGEAMALQLLHTLSVLAGFATAVHSCSLAINSEGAEKQLFNPRSVDLIPPLQLACQFSLYEVSRS